MTMPKNISELTAKLVVAMDALAAIDEAIDAGEPFSQAAHDAATDRCITLCDRIAATPPRRAHRSADALTQMGASVLADSARRLRAYYASRPSVRPAG
jgi:hypothetical protein